MACLAAIAVGAQAQLIVGNDQTGSATIWHVDVNTGAATALYTGSTNEAKPWGMAYDNTSNTLYWNNGATLYSAQFNVGGITPTQVGTMQFNSATVNFVALAFRDGKLLGTRNIATEAVYEIDTTSLVASQVYVHPTAFDYGGLEVDAANGKLYGLNDSTTAPGGRGLYEIDTVAGTDTWKAGYPAGETDIDGLAVHNGVAYYVTDGPNTTQANFYVYDIATGTQTGTLASPFTAGGTFSAATFVSDPIPEPTTMAVLGLGALAALRRRRAR